MQRRTLIPAGALGLLAALLLAVPAGAASTGTICGDVTAFTAPTAAADGSLTIDGRAETIDTSASGAIDAATRATLAALATADATTCLEITANEGGDIVDVAIASQATICGTAAVDATTGATTVDGVTLAPSALSGDADAAAALDAAADANADICVDVALDASSGLFASVGVDASFTVCGSVTADGSGNAAVEGTDIDAALLQGDASALLQLAASVDGRACVAITAVSDGTETSAAASVEVDVCAEVTAMTDDTITLGGVTLLASGSAAADAQVGDVICVTASTGPTGAAMIVEGVLGDGTGLLPNTAALARSESRDAASGAWLTLAGLGLIGSATGLLVLIRRDRVGR
jgi:large repetitive protein